MNEFLISGGVLVASLSMTYFFCLRPMRRGHCGPGERQNTTNDELELSLLQARLDIARLRAGLPDEVGTGAGHPEPSVVSVDESVVPTEQSRRTP